MFLALVGERPRPARTSKNLLAGGTGRVRLHNKSAQGLEIPMAVSDALNAGGRIAVGVGDDAAGNRREDLTDVTVVSSAFIN